MAVFVSRNESSDRLLGISDPVVGLITGLDHDRIQVATYAEGET